MSTAAAPDPTGWTSTIAGADKIEAMLSRCTRLSNIQVKLQETDGTQYLFQSGSTNYFWNTANEEGAQVTSPTNYDQLLAQMGTDISKVQASIITTE